MILGNQGLQIQALQIQGLQIKAHQVDKINDITYFIFTQFIFIITHRKPDDFYSPLK